MPHWTKQVTWLSSQLLWEGCVWVCLYSKLDSSGIVSNLLYGCPNLSKTFTLGFRYLPLVFNMSASLPVMRGWETYFLKLLFTPFRFRNFNNLSRVSQGTSDWEEFGYESPRKKSNDLITQLIQDLSIIHLQA